MEALDIEGLFWRPGEPDQKIAGRLTFNETDGAILNLTEPFSVPTGDKRRAAFTPRSLDKEPVRIVGSAGGRLLTLDDCQETEYKMDRTSVVRRRYYVYMVLSGAHFPEGEPLAFNSVTVRLRHMKEWVNCSGIDVVHGCEDSVHISYTPIKPYVTNTSWGELAVTFPWKFQHSFFESVVEQDCSATFRFATAQRLENIFRYSSSLWHLVTIGVDSPTSILSMTLSHADQPRAVELYTRWNESGTVGSTEAIDQHKILLTFDDIGGVDGIARWLSVANEYRTVTGTLVSHWYRPKMYAEYRYMNVLVAAETLSRIRLQEPRINLSAELKQLAHETSGAFRALVGDIDSWAKEVV